MKGAHIMANKIMELKDGVSVRIDNAYILNGKYLVEPFEKTDSDGNKKFSNFGTFKFFDEKEAVKTLKQAVRILNPDFDTVFDGPYPKWAEDAEYGNYLNCNNRVKFFHLDTDAEGNRVFRPFKKDEDIRDYSYTLEIAMNKTKKGEIFLRVNRAIALKPLRSFNDDLFDDLGTDGTDTASTFDFDVNNDDLPF